MERHIYKIHRYTCNWTTYAEISNPEIVLNNDLVHCATGTTGNTAYTGILMTGPHRWRYNTLRLF